MRKIYPIHTAKYDPEIRKLTFLRRVAKQLALNMKGVSVFRFCSLLKCGKRKTEKGKKRFRKQSRWMFAMALFGFSFLVFVPFWLFKKPKPRNFLSQTDHIVQNN
jgi:hypothetical protein